jgi:hypothetical protein
MSDAPAELVRFCQELADQGIWPPYTINVNDGKGREIRLDITVTFKPTDLPDTIEGEPVVVTYRERLETITYEQLLDAALAAHKIGQARQIAKVARDPKLNRKLAEYKPPPPPEPPPKVRPTDTGKSKYLDTHGYYDGTPCTCKISCHHYCEGGCGCNACSNAVSDVREWDD